MTTGRINQVTTLADGIAPSPFARMRRQKTISRFVHTYVRTRRTISNFPQRRSVFLHSRSRTTRWYRRAMTEYASRHSTLRLPRHSLRGRDTQDCRVRISTKLDRFDLSGTRSRKHRRGAVCLLDTLTVVKRLAAELLQRRRLENTRKMKPSTRPCI